MIPLAHEETSTIKTHVVCDKLLMSFDVKAPPFAEILVGEPYLF